MCGLFLVEGYVMDRSRRALFFNYEVENSARVEEDGNKKEGWMPEEG